MNSLQEACSGAPSPSEISGKSRVADSRVPPLESARPAGWSGRPALIALAAILACGASLASSRPQEEHKHKVPIMDKITSGPSRQAFSGKVQSLDLKRKLLNVNTVQGGNTEIFPVTKGVRVETADGGKLKLQALAPGTNVLIYYEQKGDQRTVRQIIVLAAGPAEQKKPSPPSP